MSGFNGLENLFVVCAFAFQFILILHFALRRWRFEMAIHYGPVVYLLSIPAAAASVLLLLGGVSWAFWLSGFLYLLWATFGYTVEYVKGLEWRSPMRWSTGGPYVSLYLATVMFYWWPLRLLDKPLWDAYALLFVASTLLNVTSHKRPVAKTAMEAT